MRVATTLLSPAEMGKVSLVISTTAFFALFLINPVGMYINRRFHTWQVNGVARHYLIKYVKYLLFVVLISAVTLIIVLITEIVSFEISFGWLVVLVCGSLFFNTINQTAIPLLNLLGDSRKFILLTVATIAASFFCATLFAIMAQPSAQFWLVGLLLGQAFMGVIGTRYLFLRLSKTDGVQIPLAIHYSNLRALFIFAWPMAIAVGFGWVQSQSYRYLMEEHLGFASLGLFVAGFGISSGLMAAFDSIFSAYFQPMFYRRISNNNIIEQSDAWHEYANSILPALLLTCLFIIAAAPDFTRLLLGPSFRESARFVIWGSLAESARIAVAVFGMIAHATMNTRILLLPNFVGALSAVLLVWYFMRFFGADGTGMGLAIASVISLLLTIFVVNKSMKITLEKRPFFKNIVWGGCLVLKAEVLRMVLPHSDSTLNSVVILLLICSLFLFLQYVNLRYIFAK